MTQKGFSLIELLVVISIIAILSAFALPTYQNYVKRSHITEGLNLSSTAKSSIIEYYVTNGSWPTSNTDAGLATNTTISGNAVTSVTVGTNGVITVVYNSKVDDTNNALTLTPTDSIGSITWACAKAGTNGIENKYLPTNCR